MLQGKPRKASKPKAKAAPKADSDDEEEYVGERKGGANSDMEDSEDEEVESKSASSKRSRAPAAKKPVLSGPRKLGSASSGVCALLGERTRQCFKSKLGAWFDCRGRS